MIQVLFVHEEQLYYEGMRAISERTDDIRFVGMAATLDAFHEQMQQERIDVAVVNIHLSSINGIALLTQLKEHYPQTTFILLTNYSDRELVVAGVLAGAKGFLLTDEPAENLLQAIRDIAKDEFIISGAAARILAEKITHYAYSRKEILRKRLINRNIHLTERELDVASLLTNERTNKEIAHELHLTEGTIKNYVSELYSKLGFDNRNELTV
ncbi:response regulator [Virgibacillus sp. W0181]|uniref:response regulator n=1 Tax=Virgibacillus sp. W0181 TaxID=3391581 RepID=UPI003F48D973